MRADQARSGAGVRDVFIAGVGQTPITKDAESRGRYLGAAAVKAALVDAGIEPERIGALYVGNMLSGILARQQQLGGLIAGLPHEFVAYRPHPRDQGREGKIFQTLDAATMGLVQGAQVVHQEGFESLDVHGREAGEGDGDLSESGALPGPPAPVLLRMPGRRSQAAIRKKTAAMERADKQRR